MNATTAPAGHRAGITITIAALIVGAQSALGVVMAVLLFASVRRLHRWTLASRIAHHRAELGVVVLLVAAVALVIALGLASRAGWARTAAVIFEAVAAVGALLRFGLHPAASLLGMALAGAVIALILASDGASGAGSPSAPRPGEPTGGSGGG